MDTVRAYGRVEDTLGRDLYEAREILDALEELEISMQGLTHQVQEEDVGTFVQPFDLLVNRTGWPRARAGRGAPPGAGR